MKSIVLVSALSAVALTMSSSFASSSIASNIDMPLPAGVSAEFRQIVAQKQIPPVITVPTNTQEWQTLQQQFDAPGVALSKAMVEKHQISYEKKQIAGVDTFIVTPKVVSEQYKDRLFVHIHGGAFVFGGQESALREAIWLATGLGAKVVSIDYRQPPLHPHPAATDDTVAVWQALTEKYDPQSMAMFGTSAGGNLTLTTTLKLQQLDLPTPAALFVGTPATDLENTSDTWHTLEGLDPLGQREGLIQATFDLYAADTPLSDPLLSPVNAQIDSFPPTVLISGTRDLLLSDTVRMHRVLRAANVDAHLHVYDGQSHGDYIYGIVESFPESDDAINELNRFFDQHMK